MEKTDYQGIDYGRGLTNIDHDTNIRYGVISAHEVGQAWYDDSEPRYFYTCPDCEHEIGDEYQDICPNCDKEFDDMDFDMIEPSFFSYQLNEEYHCEQTHDDPDIFVIKSPYYTYSQFCSPCAPGAGYLMNEMDKESGVKTYCFGHDWFETEKAPYTVYSVETNEIV